MNLVALVGRLARAPTTRFEPEGAQVTTFTLMIEEPGREAQSWRLFVPCTCLTITHNFRALRERPKVQGVDNKKGAADNQL
jgi:primosomal replication protein N